MPDHRLRTAGASDAGAVHPLGVVGVITAFNFSGGGRAWNSALAAGLRNAVDLETFGADTADGNCAVTKNRGTRLPLEPD